MSVEASEASSGALWWTDMRHIACARASGGGARRSGRAPDRDQRAIERGAERRGVAKGR